MKRVFILIAILVAMASLSAADDLYRIGVKNQHDAKLLKSSDAEPILKTQTDYLILIDDNTHNQLMARGFDLTLIAADIELDELALDFGNEADNNDKRQILFSRDNLKLFKASPNKLALSSSETGLLPIIGNQPKIYYRPRAILNPSFTLAETDLDSLTGLVNQDTIEVYENRLQAFNGRQTGTDSCYAARDWIADRFISFGCDSVVIDSFTGRQAGGPDVSSQNVIAYKTGTVYPNHHIIIGGHFDAVKDSPGADDNASGTVGVLEIARILADLETKMTFIFIAFDSEESGLIGSKHYADSAAARGDSIVYMINLDMIGNIDNDTFAKIHHSDELAYSRLWGRLADSLTGITGVLAGSAANSDHYSFQRNGYDVTYVEEYNSSLVYHKSSDSVDYINFDYMTRMIKASTATVYIVDNSPPLTNITSISDIGDGQSLLVEWELGDPTQIDHYYLHYNEVPPAQPDSILLPVDSASYIVDGLLDGQTYSFYLVSYNSLGNNSIEVVQVEATPLSRPMMPDNLKASPLLNAIKLEWDKNNSELDLSHYQIIRDDILLPDSIFDTSLIDNDPGLGSAIHSYRVIAVDNGGLASDTAGLAPEEMRAATLEQSRILAINRSSIDFNADVNVILTGEFMREALTGLNYEYLSDSSSVNPDRANLFDLLDYEIVIVGAESGRGFDDIAGVSSFLIDDLADYLSAGGKLIIFGRWGNVSTNPLEINIVYYQPGFPNDAYYHYFNTAYRTLPLTEITAGPAFVSDFVGANSQLSGYPELVWDSLATLNHISPAFISSTGIPCPSIPHFSGTGNDVLYTYNSRDGYLETDNKPIAWRHIGGSMKYIFFDIPFSFMNRVSAVAALRRAVHDLGITVAVDDDDNNLAAIPDEFSLTQNYPNPFNPSTTIEFYNPEIKPAIVTIDVYNITGQKLKTIFNGWAVPGINKAVWDGKTQDGESASSGVYFYRLKSNEAVITRKMLLIK